MTPQRPGDSSVQPTLNAQDLMSAIPGINELATIHAATLQQVASIHLQLEHLLSALDWAKAQVAAGAAGVILTQGTDTLEESAFLLDLLWPYEEPLILMGAMRSADRLSADGPSNLLQAVQVATSVNSRNRGVLVVMNGDIHYARWVQKKHSLNLAAFVSDVGLAGTLVEGQSHYFAAPPKRINYPRPQQVTKKVALWLNHLDEDSTPLQSSASEFDGMVFAGVGAGHVTPHLANSIGQWVQQQKSIIICSATGAGSTTFATYGYPGGEVDLQNIGAMMGGFLSPKKARLWLWVILENGLAPQAALQDYLSSLTY